MSNGVNGDQLRQLIERVETVENTIREEQEARKEIYAEARSVGFDARIIRKIVAARKKAAAARREEQELLALYAEAINQPDLFG
jgi:uncharacterized protein (UPF0335 family)